MRHLLLITALVFTCSVFAMQYGKIAKVEKTLREDRPTDYETLTLSIEIEIPANHLPEKSTFIMAPVFFGIEFSQLVFQDVEAEGNAQAIKAKIGGKITYTDDVDYEVYMNFGDETGQLTIEQLVKNKKPKPRVLDVSFNVPINYYFDSSKKKYMTFTASYTLN